MKKLLFAVLFCLSPLVNAQMYTWDCITRMCTFVTDPWPLIGVQPNSCRLYNNGAIVQEVPPQTLQTGERYCLWSLNFAAGNVTLWATAIGGGGFESARSNIVQASIQGGMQQAPEAPQVLRRISQ